MNLGLGVSLSDISVRHEEEILASGLTVENLMSGKSFTYRGPDELVFSVGSAAETAPTSGGATGAKKAEGPCISMRSTLFSLSGSNSGTPIFNR